MLPRKIVHQSNSQFMVSFIIFLHQYLDERARNYLNCIYLSFSLANPPKPTLTRSSKFNTMFPGESVTFTCKVDASSGWSYLWYHNNTEIQPSDAFRVDINHSKSGQYHCKAKRGKSPFFTEVSEATTLQVSGKLFTFELTSPTIRKHSFLHTWECKHMTITIIITTNN